VSRHHARVRISGETATIEDLGSRNGVRINGRLTGGAIGLGHNDRIRIGTQELVFCKLPDQAEQTGKTTGYLRHCSRCQTPYPEEMVACPNCGLGDSTEETTQSSVRADGHVNWTLQLLLEVLDKALSMNKATDAERFMARAAAQMEERINLQENADVVRLNRLAESAVRLAGLQENGRWLSWVWTIYTKLDRVPSLSFLDHFAALPYDVSIETLPALEQFLSVIRTRTEAEISDDDQSGLERIETFLPMLRPLHPRPQPHVE